MPIPRALIATAAAATLYAGSAVAMAPAGAHVHATSDHAVRGDFAIVTFSVPNESDTGAATTQLTVTLPDVVSARTESIPGWAVALDRDTASGTVRSVTWTATPNGGIPVDQFGLFQISMKLPDTDTVSFPATQTYSDGSVVTWDQPPLPDGGEPEHPAPRLTLAAGPTEHQLAGQPDNTARWLAGTALLVAAAGVALTLVRRRT